MRLSLAQRLVVAADIKQPEGIPALAICELARWLKGTGVTLKLNSALRLLGYSVIRKIRDEHGLDVFADLKLNDIPQTLEYDGVFLREVNPRIVTVMCSAGVEGMKRLRDALPDTEILGVTVLTSLSDQDCRRIYGRSSVDAVVALVELAQEAGIDGLVMSPMDLQQITRSKTFDLGSMTVNTPGVRPEWARFEGDDQNPASVMTPSEAIRAGADRIIVGRPILQSESVREAVMRTLAEIAQAA